MHERGRSANRNYYGSRSIVVMPVQAVGIMPLLGGLVLCVC